MTALPAASITSSALDDLDALNAQLEGLRADERVAWALQHGPQDAALSSSFGAQSAVTLHLLSQQRPDIPVILIDTGYLFPETYRFADALTERLKLNLKVYRPLVSRAWMEARHGRLWEQGMVGIDQYNNLRKVEPMRRALDELNVGTWFTGLRRSQSTKSAPSLTGPIATCGSTCRRTSCRTTHCGNKATCPSAISTPRVAGNPAYGRKTRASLA